MIKSLKALSLSLALALPATGAVAQDLLTPDEFLDIAVGNTLTFRDAQTGQLIGIEQFLARDRSKWTRADGTCVNGDISVRGAAICFDYPDDPRTHCWWPIMDQGEIYVRFATLSSSSIQQVTEITQDPVICEEVPSV
ncbi:hypothetical protein [Pontivivens insulae]|uniref:Uncharacterized protein n=1 Tax=Pontivivens insulae TaxID=1639689 RepID=A0A2R8AFQ2_9RHOB|nr:hypothetical protein [Pontivivens insulae]RED12316.1 hypothetical protein DFR53_3035 [Pontivivens insulae]SPF31072.1 hypothetical protein POI8812_03423 [Pontivivens insulae]